MAATDDELLTTTAPRTTPSTISPYVNERLSIPFPLRLPAATLAASATGLFLGSSLGGKSAGLRFRAENAHRLPESQVGWYLYHKSKNYHVMLGALKEGAKMSLKLGWWVGLFVGVEEAVDRGRAAVSGWRRGREWVEDEDEARGRDFMSTVVAGLGISGAFSVWTRTATSGLKFALVYGLLQDAVGILRGRRIAYVDFLHSIVSGKKREERAERRAIRREYGQGHT
ncbi:hypothetical protein LTR66_010500 [Elasticomyces elasticus]|nr:hypothetical protein LTR28_012090 [Elasticomyces elasticus]KAK4979454.1 hypothetical protein LTR66_010500 [Elasticomyces elasticus]